MCVQMRPWGGRQLWRAESRPLWRAGAPASSSPIHAGRYAAAWRRPAQWFPLPEEVRRSATRFLFELGVYQRHSIVVDPGSSVQRGHSPESLFLRCRRHAPPATPVWPTSFAPQRTHACRTFRIRGYGGSRRAQHRTFMFAGPRDARERNGRQMHGNGARRSSEGWAWLSVRFDGPLARASRGWWHGGKVIGGGVMPHHATPNHFILARPSARRACQRAVKPY